MIKYPTVGIQTTDSRTRIAALELLTGLVRGAVAVGDALGSTRFVRIAMILRQTLAGAGIALLMAKCIRTTWIRIAGLQVFLLLYGSLVTIAKRISIVARSAIAHGHVAKHVTNGIDSTSAWTRIHTLLLHAGLVEATF